MEMTYLRLPNIRLAPQGWKKNKKGSFKEEPLPETQEGYVNDTQQKSTWTKLIKS
jgi:hypothetical protein